MDYYHSWIYEHIFNTRWFIWTIVVSVFSLNFLGPILIWLVMNSKSLPFIPQKKEQSVKENPK
ncbi:MAG TPA: hypothetical protein VK190_05410 [Pseudoneobacillus sp.]|nr:hypothetical protein [Pseudoneobacillus sp.]